VEECFTATCGVEDLVGGLARAALSLFASGVKTGCTWQKCSFRLRNCGSDGRLGIRVFPAILEIMSGLGHSCEAVEFLTLGAFIRVSRVYSESRGESAGSSTSINSPGQIVVEVGGTGVLLHGVPRN